MMGSIPILHHTGHGDQTRTRLLKLRSGSWRLTQGLSQTQPQCPLYPVFVLSFRSGSQRSPVLSGKLSYVCRKICVTFYPQIL